MDGVIVMEEEFISVFVRVAEARANNDRSDFVRGKKKLLLFFKLIDTETGDTESAYIHTSVLLREGAV